MGNLSQGTRQRAVTPAQGFRVVCPDLLTKKHLEGSRIMALRLAVATEDFGSSLKKSIARASQCEVGGLRLNTRTEVPADKTSD